MKNFIKNISKLGGYAIYSFGAIILSCHPSLGMEDEEILPPWSYGLKVCEPDGKLIQEQLAYNPVYLHGFDDAHHQGINGQGMSIAFLETGVDKNHSQFKPDQIDIIDCSQHEEIIGEDKAIYRDKRDFSFRRLLLLGTKHSNEHGNHVMGVALSQPRKISYTTSESFILSNPRTSIGDGGCGGSKVTVCTGEYPGGCCPESRGILHAFSTFYHKDGRTIDGASILSIEQSNLLNKTIMTEEEEIPLEEYYAQLQPSLTPEEKIFINEMPIDRSPLIALEEALAGPSFAINWSFTPYFRFCRICGV